jgi:membrane protein implicated in regulation of membrane protease activity
MLAAMVDSTRLVAAQRSPAAYEEYREAAQRFEYFVLGVSVALIAYVGRTLEPHKLGWSAYSLQIMAVAILVASAVVGFLKMRQIVFLSQCNHDKLHLEERSGILLSTIQNGPFLNALSGEYWTEADVKKEVTNIQQILPDRLKQLDKIESKITKLDKWRNALLAVGFISLVVGRILEPYFPA